MGARRRRRRRRWRRRRWRRARRRRRWHGRVSRAATGLTENLQVCNSDHVCVRAAGVGSRYMYLSPPELFTARSGVAARCLANGLCRIEGVYPYARLTPGLPPAYHAPRLTAYPRLIVEPPLTTRLGVAGRHLGPQAVSRRSQGDTERRTVPTELCVADCGAAQQAGGRGRVRRAVSTLPPYRTHAPPQPSLLCRSTSPELILQPITIHRSEIEYTTIEPAVNSARRSRPPAHPLPGAAHADGRPEARPPWLP